MTEDGCEETAGAAAEIDSGEGEEQVAKVEIDRRGSEGWLLEEATSGFESGGDVAWSHEAVMSNFDEAFR